MFYARKSQEFEVKKASRDVTTLAVRAKISVLPQIDSALVVGQITGKYPNQAKAFLESLNGVKQIDILISPHLPTSIMTLPRVSNRINLTVRPLE